MKILFSALLISFSAAVSADSNNLPSSCKPIQVEGTSAMLTAKKPVLIMIQNSSTAELWVTHPVSEPGASAGWSSRLQAGNWSALALDKNAFELNCIESKPGHEQQIPCSTVISLCKWSTVAMSAKEKGTFWAGENMPLPGLISHLEGRGFKLPAL
ncbi:MAG: hypothetical protein H0T84_06930 [Tatlockia sp.]|nr:hypothetical protein [Tatlockia sp.]